MALKGTWLASAEKLKIEEDYHISPRHSAHNIRLWLLYNCPKVIETFTQSPDLNTIEHLWRKKGSGYLEKLKRLSSSPEIADALPKDGVAQHTMNSAALTYSELHSTYINNKQLPVPPAHHWYEAKRPGGFLSFQCSRQGQTILTRFLINHLKILTLKDRNKVFPTCVSFSVHQASQEHTFLTATRKHVH
ncbi:RNase H domain-containing protein [Trichonephila clavipes]|uniref:RNase H domain-containing protein n=1 Tax=Trichonephila clavipes TaxID=2585209 RepID=A0A8X6W6F9_TRICX|nr:RNase H domain-containing protein [Trichonephila clavipes]